MRDHREQQPTARQWQRQRRLRSASPLPEIEVNHSNVCLGRPKEPPKFTGRLCQKEIRHPKLIKKLKLPTSREEATWQLLSIFNNYSGSTAAANSTPAQEQEHALKILRLHPDLAKEPFYCKNQPVYGAVSWLPLHHFVSRNAPVGYLKELVKMNHFPLQPNNDGSNMNITPLHVACRLPLGNNDGAIMFLASAYPEALLISSDPYGFPLQCLLHRPESLCLDFHADGGTDSKEDREQGGDRDGSLCLIQQVLEHCPQVLSLYDHPGTGVLATAIHKRIHIDKLKYIVDQMMAHGVKELNLGEPTTTSLDDDNDLWAVQCWQVKIITRLLPQLHSLKCTMRHWRRDAMIGFLESIPTATRLAILHLDLPDDLHLEHWNGAALKTFHTALVQAISINQTLRDLSICLYSRRKELVYDLSGGCGWSHDETFLAIVTAFTDDVNSTSISRLTLQNFHLQVPSHLRGLLASGYVPGEIELVNVLLGGPWEEADKGDWKVSRLQRLTIQGSLSPKNDWLAQFLNEPTKASVLSPLTLDFDDKPNATPNQDNSEVSSCCTWIVPNPSCVFCGTFPR